METNQHKFHFISGLPRSGSTLLSAILRQNPRFQAGITSPVGSLFTGMLGFFSAGNEHSSVIGKDKRKQLVKGLFANFYDDVNDKEIIFDTNRLWCSQLPELLDIFPESKVIACVRNVSWVMDSIERRFRENLYENTILFSNQERKTVYSRLHALAGNDRLVGFAWAALREAYYGEQASSLLIVDYDLLAQAPEKVVPLIYEFIGEPYFDHDFNNVEFDAPTFDKTLGMAGLHHVRKKVSFDPRRTILPPDLFEKFNDMEFWKDQSGTTAHVISAKKTDASITASPIAETKR